MMIGPFALRAMGWLNRLPREFVLLAAMGLLLALMVWRADALAGQRDRAREQARQLQAAVSGLQADLALRTLADLERTADDRAIAALEKELTDAITHHEDAAPHPMRVALGCVRLQRAGTAVPELPLACRSAGGAKTAPRP